MSELKSEDPDSSPHMRTLAIDLGKRRIGLALSDERGAIATPLQVIEITSLDQAHDHILATQRFHIGGAFPLADVPGCDTSGGL